MLQVYAQSVHVHGSMQSHVHSSDVFMLYTV